MRNVSKNLFRGRIGRRDFFLAYLILLLLLFGIFLPLNFESVALGLYLYFFIPIILVFLILGISLQVRRLHDMNFSGLFIFVMVISIIMAKSGSDWGRIFYYIDALYWAVLFFSPGKNENNKYGDVSSKNFNLVRTFFNI